ncbi:hypothetical protein PsorP6_013783 [Peronosclerospora sorghi]|uniref:Uncharacterized protein n=1 Tax=Peronosclerospora sorghi TaxID=230839 RepID=A0ACC0VGL5_9STRA|nr:hypothetical protein PsorP6_013783 [Peronosclerospora sorghi]
MSSGTRVRYAAAASETLVVRIWRWVKKTLCTLIHFPVFQACVLRTERVTESMQSNGRGRRRAHRALPNGDGTVSRYGAALQSCVRLGAVSGTWHATNRVRY